MFNLYFLIYICIISTELSFCLKLLICIVCNIVVGGFAFKSDLNVYMTYS